MLAERADGLSNLCPIRWSKPCTERTADYMLRLARRSTDLAAFALSFSFLLVAPTTGLAATVATAGDASISREPTAGTWTLSSGGASLTLTLDAARDFTVSRLESPSGINWVSSPIADSIVKVGDRTLSLGNRS